MSEYDFTPRVNPMQGISLADLVAARTSPLTTALQQGPAIIQALNAQKQMAQRQQLIAQASGGDPQTSALLGLGIVPPAFKGAPQKTTEQLRAEAEARAEGTGEGRANYPMSFTRKQDQEQFDETLMAKISQLSPVNIKSGLVHVASINNGRADRALTNLKDPNMVMQQLDAISADVAGIMQGGVPHEQGQARQSFGNILTRVAQMRSYITSTPTAINNPKTVEKLKQIVLDIKKVDNAIIKNHLDVTYAGYSELFKRKPDFAKKWYDEGMKSMTGFGQSETIRVRLKSSGQTGTIPLDEFDSNIYEKI